MPEPNANQDPDDRSILDSDEPNNGNPSDEEVPPEAEHQDAGASDEPTDAPTTVDDLHFDDDDLGENLRHASDEQLDNAPFGIIQVDDEGTIEFFNQYESDLSGMDAEEVKDRNFFTQVAPCTNNRLFRGRFKKGVRRGELDETFSYTYTYKMRPTLVDIHLYRDEDGNNWITVQKY
jgi:photoactive yellow protein